jgi:hypothetical protein
MSRASIRFFALGVAALTLAPIAALADTYAVVPLITQQLTLVAAEPVTSTNLDRNRYQIVPLKDDGLDQAIRVAVDRAIRARRSGDSMFLVRVDVPPATDNREELGIPLERIVEAVAPRAVEASADRLILIAGTMYSAARARDNDPFNALTNQQKVAGLQQLLQTELIRLIPG